MSSRQWFQLLGGALLGMALSGCPGFSPADRYPCRVNGDCPSQQPLCCPGEPTGLCGTFCTHAASSGGVGASSGSTLGLTNGGSASASAGSSSGGCREPGSACDENANCCGGGAAGGACVCPETGCTASQVGVCCGRDGAQCNQGSDCCSGNCAGVCQCSSLGSSCHDAYDCCGYPQSTYIGCSGAGDSPLCCAMSGGGPCASDDQCCQSTCNTVTHVCD